MRGRAARLIVTTLAVVLAGTVSPGVASEAAIRGRQLLRQHCGACHAIGTAGQSAHPAAPPFRRIGRRQDIAALTERMGEILVSTHRDMPSFRVSRTDARAIRAYLLGIQE